MTSALRSLVAGVAPMLLLAAAAAAQSPASSTEPRPYHPGIDVLDYDVTLTLPDSGSFIRGDVVVTARRAAGVSTLQLDLVDRLRVRGVEVNGLPVGPVHARGKIDVPLGSTTADTVRVRVRYDGMVTDGLIARKDDRGRWTWFGDNWPDRARQWLPTVDHPGDKATVSWTVRAPAGYTVVANGALIGVRALGGRSSLTETRWREGHPVPTYVMVIGVGPLERVDLTDGACALPKCVPQSVYVLPEHRDWLPGPFAAAPRIVSLFERLIGPFPYEKLAHVQSATRFGGMENATAIFYSGDLFATRRLSERLIAHETAHQWFGDAVTEREWAHLWLSEGFATYFAALWIKEARGDSAFRAELAAIRQEVLADSTVMKRPVIDTAERNYLALLNANSYQKGGYVLHMLHRRLGDEAFFRGLRAYYARRRDGVALTDDLRHDLERASGEQLAGFFDQWLRRPGYPRPAVGWAFDAGRGAISVLVQQESPAGAAPYELPLVVAVRDSAGQERRLELTVPAVPRAELTLPGRYARPVSVVFDPDAFLLARIRML